MHSVRNTIRMIYIMQLKIFLQWNGIFLDLDIRFGIKQKLWDGNFFFEKKKSFYLNSFVLYALTHSRWASSSFQAARCCSKIDNNDRSLILIESFRALVHTMNRLCLNIERLPIVPREQLQPMCRLFRGICAAFSYTLSPSLDHCAKQECCCRGEDRRKRSTRSLHNIFSPPSCIWILCTNLYKECDDSSQRFIIGSNKNTIDHLPRGSGKENPWNALIALKLNSFVKFHHSMYNVSLRFK